MVRVLVSGIFVFVCLVLGCDLGLVGGLGLMVLLILAFRKVCICAFCGCVSCFDSDSGLSAFMINYRLIVLRVVADDFEFRGLYLHG